MQFKEKIENIFMENKLPYDWWMEGNDVLHVTVEDGDWKHDHIRLKYILANFYILPIDRLITKENDDDTFSAEYFFKDFSVENKK